MVKRFALGNDLGGLSDNEQPRQVQSPVGVCSMACFVSLAFIYFAARPLVSRLQVWWAELLVYALIPTVLTFILLYRSSWHREITGAARTLSLALLSSVILGGVLIADTIFIILLALVYSTFIDGFTRIHY